MTKLSPAAPGAGAVLVMVALASGFAPPTLVAQEPQPGIEFSASGVPGLDTIYLAGVDTDDPGGLLGVEIRANEVTDLYGVSVALKFPEKLLRFPKSRSSVFVEGPFLSEDGAEETILLVRQVGDEIIVGLTRKGEVGGVSGSGLLLSLEFRGLEVPGRKSFRLRRVAAFSPYGEEIENTTWLAGKVEVRTAE